MQSLLLLWNSLLVDTSRWCCTSDAGRERDYRLLSRRFEHEGVNFLSIALPRFASDLHRSLDDGSVDPGAFAGFHRRGALPVFLGEYLDLVFDRETGYLLKEPSHAAIVSLRQLTMFYGKILVDASQRRKESAVELFLECEQEVAQTKWSRELLDEFRAMSRLAFGSVLTEMDRLVYENDLLPKHGPGSTADGLEGNLKWTQLEWTERLEEVFHCVDYLIPNYRYHSELGIANFLEPSDERPVKVTLVPKTPKTPRIIAIEPTCMQFMQQAIAVPLTNLLQSSRIGRYGVDNPSFGLLGFREQGPNRDLAKHGSLSGELATLDLSEASDRVSNELVLAMMQDFPWLSKGIQACRSTRALLPGDRGMVPLSKFASMGSALCFPIEAMVFLTVVLLGIADAQSARLSSHDVSRLRGRVRIYGDDIIVPVDYVRCVISRLEAFGLKVNYGKSFWTGKFRESCGGDYYDGEDVTPVRVRRVLPTSRTDVKEIVSAVSLRNLLYQQGYWNAASHLDGILEPMLRYYPVVSPESLVLGRISFLGVEAQRLCPSLHRPLVKGWVKRDRIPSSHIEGYAALLKVLSKQGVEPFADKDHLERQGRPETVGIKLRWSYSQ